MNVESERTEAIAIDAEKNILKKKGDKEEQRGFKKWWEKRMGTRAMKGRLYTVHAWYQYRYTVHDHDQQRWQAGDPNAKQGMEYSTAGIARINSPSNYSEIPGTHPYSLRKRIRNPVNRR
jgi:hypothetical protein